MIKILITAAVLGATTMNAALAQSNATSNDPIVQMRTAEREATRVYAASLLKAWSDRQTKVNAAVEVATNKAAEEGKDPLVAKRDAIAKAEKATKPEYDAAVKAATQQHKAAMAAAKKKGSGS